jgi:hypothetical protein
MSGDQASRPRGARQGGPLAELDEIRRLVAEQDDRSRELQAKLDDLERALVARAAGIDADTESNEDRMPAR